MEVHARYVLMGLFALGVIALGLGFVYWLEAGSGLGTRLAYAIRYEGQVAGLLRGSAGARSTMSKSPIAPRN